MFNQPLINVCFEGLPARKKKKLAKCITKEVTKSRTFKKTFKKVDKLCGCKTPNRVKKAVVKTTVERTLGVKPRKPLIVKKKSALDTYTEMVEVFATCRKVCKERQKQKMKAAVKAGYDPKTGFYKLQKLQKLQKLPKAVKLPKAKKIKYRKVKTI